MMTETAQKTKHAGYTHRIGSGVELTANERESSNINNIDCPECLRELIGFRDELLQEKHELIKEYRVGSDRRERIATAALNAIISTAKLPGPSEEKVFARGVALFAVEHADALIVELDKEPIP